MDKTELMKDVLKVTGIAPIIAYAEPEQAVPAAKALVAGGLPVVEILMRNEHAMGNLERIARDVPEIVAGAGTIITLDQAKAAIDHGAQFIIMPGIGRQVVEYCIDKKIPVIPNCITPGEMTMAVEYGLDMVKFFPIYQLGVQDGAQYILDHYPVKLVFVTCGADGCWFQNCSASGHVDSLKGITVVDTTGAGDIFGGSAVWKLLQTGKAPEALDEAELRVIVSFACKAAGLSTTKHGGISSVPDSIS